MVKLPSCFVMDGKLPCCMPWMRAILKIGINQEPFTVKLSWSADSEINLVENRTRDQFIQRYNWGCSRVLTPFQGWRMQGKGGTHWDIFFSSYVMTQVAEAMMEHAVAKLSTVQRCCPVWNHVKPIFDAAALALLWDVFSLWFRRHDEICESYPCPFSMGQFGRFIPIYIRLLMPDKSIMPPKFEAESIVFWSLQTNEPANQLRSSLLQLVYTCFGVLALYWDCIEYIFSRMSKWSTSWSGWPFAREQTKSSLEAMAAQLFQDLTLGKAKQEFKWRKTCSFATGVNHFKVIWFSWLGNTVFCVDLQCI